MNICQSPLKQNPYLLYIMVIAFTCPDGSAVIYPKSGLISFQGRLFRLREGHCTKMLLLSFQIHHPPAVTIKLGDYGRNDKNPKYKFFLHIITECRTEETAYTPTTCIPRDDFHAKELCNGIFIDTINPKWRRLQRWLRKTAQKCMAPRKLALAMALHDRLGANCGAAVLGLDGMMLVAEQISGEIRPLQNQLQAESALPYDLYRGRNRTQRLARTQN